MNYISLGCPCNYLMNKARKQFHTNFISENRSNQRDLFNATRKLLRQENAVLLPLFKDRLQLVNEIGEFFIKKISNIHFKLDKMTEELRRCYSVPLVYDCESVATTQTVSQLTEGNARDLVLSSAKKTCMLDPIPTPLVPTCLDVLLFCFTESHLWSKVTMTFRVSHLVWTLGWIFSFNARYTFFLSSIFP